MNGPLFDWYPITPRSAPEDRATLQAKFDEWLADNPGVYREVVRLAREWRSKKGAAPCAIAMIWEVMRWEGSLRTTGDDFKLNNSWRSRLARLVMEREPDLAGIFEVRELRA